MDVVLVLLLGSHLTAFLPPCEIAGIDQELQIMAAVSVFGQLIGIRISVLPEGDKLFSQIFGRIVTSLLLPDMM